MKPKRQTRFNRARFTTDDPLRDFHVPRRQRLSADGGLASDAAGGAIDFDRAEVRKNIEVVSEENLG